MKSGATLPKCIFVLASAALATSCGGGEAPTSPTSPPVVVAPPAPPPTPPPPTPPPPPVTKSALTHADANIGECINLSNMLEAPNEGDWGRAFVDADFADIAAKGFKTLRLPARFSNHAGTAPPYTVEPAFMNRVEKAVTLARAAGLRVIIDNHFYDALMSNPAAERDRFVAIWKQVADRFKGADSMVWFELLNEPNGQLTHANLLSILNPALTEVRATNPTRPVVIGGESFSNVRTLANLPLPNDRYLVATFHYYDPFNFTHQGASFLTNPPATGRAFGSTADINEINGNVRLVQDFMTRTGVPVFYGEYGAYEGIPMAERAKFYKSTHDAYKAINVNGCAWGYANTFNFRANAVGGAWNQDLLSAIGL